MRSVLLAISFLLSTALSIAGNPDSLLKIASQQKKDSSYVLLLTRIADQYDELGQYELALDLCKQAIHLGDSLHYKMGVQAAYNRMGNCYIDIGDVKKALESHLKALKIREELGHKNGVGYTWLNLGNIYFRLGEDDNSLKSYHESLRMLGETKDSIGVATCLANMGAIYSNRRETAEAEKHYLRALGIRQRAGKKEGVAEIYSNLSIVFMDAEKYKQALLYAFRALDNYGEAGNKLGKAISYSNIGDIYEHMNEFNNAVKYQEIALQMAREMKSQYMMQTCYQLLALAYGKKNDYQKALLYSELYSSLTDSMMNSENGKLITEMQTKFETEKKQKEIELLQKDNSIRELQISEQAANINRQRILIYSAIGGLILVIVLVVFILKSYREKKRINEGLEKKNEEINKQRAEIAEKNLLITDSIEYAKSIQQAILPPEKIILEHLPDSFILFQPKDIVSGDFYWMHVQNEKILFAAVDCTGHGVPGAFMSVMAYNMLENIVKSGVIQPSLILDMLNKTVLETLHQESDTVSAKYGMDIALVSLDQKNQSCEFAGAHNSLYVVSKGTLKEHKADNATIGMARQKFTNHAATLNTGDMLYLYTDGYPDQKGGPRSKKLYFSEFRKLIQGLAGKTGEEQKVVLLKEHTDWKGNHEQIDDVLVVGIRV